MIQKEILELDLTKYISVYKKHIHPYPVFLAAFSYFKFIKKFLKADLSSSFVVINDGTWHSFINEEEWNNILNVFIIKYKNNNNFLYYFFKKVKNISIELLNFTSKLETINCSKLSNKKLLELYKTFNNMYITFFIYSECSANSLMFESENILLKMLSKELNSEEEARKVLSLLILPNKKSFMRKEEEEFLKIATSAFSKKSYKKKLEKHLKKYSWIPVDYNGNSWSIEDLELRLKNILSSNKDPKKILKKLKEGFKNLLNKKKQSLKKYNLSQKFLKLCNDTSNAMKIMDFKKEICSKAHYHVQFLMNAIAQRLNLSLIQANYLTPKEISAALLDNQILSKNTLNKRYKFSVYKTETKDINFLDEETSKYIAKKLKNLENTDSIIKGICSNPGIVKGKARVIIKNSDFSKMKKGEILVTPYTTPDYSILMKKAIATITDLGGITSHASIVSRELNIPCITGTKNASELIKSGDLIEVNADFGIVKILKSKNK